ncbi:MAG: PBP1A family penicillin-binding protein [Devosia sp.]
MRRKNAGALFMDFHVSDDDRIGGGGAKKARGKTPAPAKGRKPAKSNRNDRVEPGFGSASVSGERATRGKAAKQPRNRRGREREPFTLGRLVGRLFYWLFVLGIWGGIALVGVVVYFFLQMPPQSEWAIPERAANIRVVASDGQLISNRGKSGGQAVSLYELPAYVPAAFVAIEDRRFYQHFGIDLVGLASVAVESVRAGEVTRGASTITQQVAKNLFLTPDQELSRKVQEAVLAFWLERTHTKDEILELYLNRMNFGHEKYGIEAAAQFYFGKSARNLSLSEATILAGSLQAPSRLNPKGKPELVRARQALVLQAMAKEGYISDKEAKAAAIDPTQTIRTKVAGAESYVADWVESLMTAYVGEVKEDVVVYTTINWDLQKEAEFLVKEAVSQEGAKAGFSQGALVALDVDGAVRAVVGGADYQKSQYNRAVTSRRQPGSTFKPFVYMAAMEKGFTPDTTAQDAPIDIDGWKPENADGKYMGQITLRDALAYSRNSVAAQLAINVGPDKVVEVAQRFGISSPLMAVPSIALGTQEVSLLELTAAYAPFANGGNGVIANVITRIETADGKVLYDAIPAGPGPVATPEVIGEMNDMLSTALQVGTGKRAHLNGWPIAGKTGTSQKARDALFVGYTARMVTGIWLGNDDDTPTKLSGGSIPTQIWSDFMTKAHEGFPIAELPGAYTVSDEGLAPMEQEQPRRSTKTIVDILSGIFGGGQ